MSRAFPLGFAAGWSVLGLSYHATGYLYSVPGWAAFARGCAAAWLAILIWAIIAAARSPAAPRAGEAEPVPVYDEADAGW